MDRFFEYRDVTFKQHERGKWVVAKGEITNKSGRDYYAAVFRIIVFKRSIAIASVSFSINGFTAGQTRLFEKHIEELDYGKFLQDMSHHEIYVESAY